MLIQDQNVGHVTFLEQALEKFDLFMLNKESLYCFVSLFPTTSRIIFGIFHLGPSFLCFSLHKKLVQCLGKALQPAEAKLSCYPLKVLVFAADRRRLLL